MYLKMSMINIKLKLFFFYQLTILLAYTAITCFTEISSLPIFFLELIHCSLF